MDLKLVPQVLNLALYAGDGVSFKLVVTDQQGEPVAVDGEVLAQIRTTRDAEDLIVEFIANLPAPGEIELSLAGHQTRLLVNGSADMFKGVWDCQWTAEGGEPLTLIQGNVTCVLDVSRP